MRDFLAQAAKLLKKQKQYRRQMVVFLCLAVIVTFGTVTALKLYGQAMTHQVEVLDCQYEVHEHTDDCYEKDENGNLGTEPVCGYADYVVHVHNDSCYDEKGDLVCTLEEREPHEHTEECFVTEKVLICELEETEEAEAPAETPAPTSEPTAPEEPVCGKEPHTHGEGCYEDALVCGFAEEHVHGEACASQTLTCAAEEHAHGEGCYDADGNLTCGLEEHAHQEGCYTTEYTCGKEEHTHTEGCHDRKLTCALEEHEHIEACYAQADAAPAEPQETPEAAEESETPAHIHTDECYEEVTRVVCGELELHTHDDSCYDEECFDEDGNLIEGSLPSCELPQLEEHVHTEECFKTVELTPEEVAALNQGAKLHIHTEDCYDGEGNLICGHDATHIHLPECYDDAGKLICGYGTSAHVHEAKCYDGEGKLICGYETATHPHNESCYDAEGNLQCGYETATHVHGESCYDEDGNVICGYEAAVHAHEAACYDAAGNLICGYGTAPDAEDADTVKLNGTFTYEAEDYTLEIHIQTDIPLESPEPDAPAEPTTGSEESKTESGSEAEAPSAEEGSSTEPAEAESQPVEDDSIEESKKEANTSGIVELSEVYEGDTDTTVPEAEGSQEGSEDAPEDTNSDEAEGQPEPDGQILMVDEASGLTLEMSPLDAGEEIYAEMASFIEGNGGSKLLDLSVMRLHVYRDGKEIDISNCTVAVNITPKAATTEELVEAFGEEAAAEEDAGIIVSAIQKTADGIGESASVFLKPNMEKVPILQNAVAVNGILAIARYVNENTITKTFKGDNFTVTATYKLTAEIPAEAELIMEQITEEGNSEYYAKRQEAYRKIVSDEEAAMRALLKMGFYVKGEDGEKLQEVELENPIRITLQFLDEDELVKGKPINVIHFANDEIKMLEGSNVESGSTTFEMRSVSEIAIGYGEGENAKLIKDGKLYISNDFECDVDPFHIVFHVEGEPKTMDGKSVIINFAKTKEGEDAAGKVDSEGTETEDTTSDAETEENESLQEDETPEYNGTENADVADKAIDSEENASDSVDLGIQEVKFYINSLEEDFEIREALEKYIGESTEEVSRNILHLISYHLTYGETELDLSDCKVTAEISVGMSSSSEGQENFDSEQKDGGTEAEQTKSEQEDGGIEAEQTIDTEAGSFIVSDSGKDDGEIVDIVPQESVVVNELPENAEAVQTLKNVLNAEDTDTEISLMAIGISEDQQISTIGQVTLNGENPQGQMEFQLNNGIMALAEESTSNPTFKVQYYAYVQMMAKTGDTSIKIIDTVKEGMDGILGGAQLPDNTGMPRTREMYVNPSQVGPYTTGWPVYDVAYIDKDSTDSLTKIYTADFYEFKEASGGLEHINKFAKEGLHYDLYEIWVLNDATKVDETKKEGWTVYRGDDINKIVFRNNDVTVEGEITVKITADTVIRLVGRSNNEVNKNYPARFFDYDFTDGTNDNHLKGINNPSNYQKDANGKVIEPRYGIGNFNSPGKDGKNTGLANDKGPGTSDKYELFINRAKTKKGTTNSVDTIIEKCFFGLTESALSEEGYPIIKVNAPDLFNPKTKNVAGRTEISGYSLNFNRDGDTYTLTSVSGSGNSAQNLDQFQKFADKAWGTKEGVVMTNQFWPMDNAPTFGDTAHGHDPKFGTKAQYEKLKFIEADDGQEHNSFFGMNFEVEFELTDDYVGPLNYYFFGDDDMWVFLEKPDGSTQLICDIGGVHQAAGEYVDLWNYIQKPEDSLVENNGSGETAEEEGRVNPKYKLKFFYTERGASGSTCWMQFTLPSVNAVPVIDYTGNVKSTLKLGKTVEGEPTNERFDFTIEFSGSSSNIATNDYPYQIKNEDGSIVETGDIRSGGTFKLGHKQTIEVFNLPDDTKYIIKEKDYGGYEPALGTETVEGVVIKDKTVEGNIDWDRDDIVDYINKEVEYHLPETGGSGAIPYTMAGGIVVVFGAGFLYRKKFRERRGRRI